MINKFDEKPMHFNDFLDLLNPEEKDDALDIISEGFFSKVAAVNRSDNILRELETKDIVNQPLEATVEGLLKHSAYLTKEVPDEFYRITGGIYANNETRGASPYAIASDWRVLNPAKLYDMLVNRPGELQAKIHLAVEKYVQSIAQLPRIVKFPPMPSTASSPKPGLKAPPVKFPKVVDYGRVYFEGATRENELKRNAKKHIFSGYIQHDHYFGSFENYVEYLSDKIKKATSSEDKQFFKDMRDNLVNLRENYPDIPITKREHIAYKPIKKINDPILEGEINENKLELAINKPYDYSTRTPISERLPDLEYKDIETYVKKNAAPNTNIDDIEKIFKNIRMITIGGFNSLPKYINEVHKNAIFSDIIFNNIVDKIVDNPNAKITIPVILSAEYIRTIRLQKNTVIKLSNTSGNRHVYFYATPQGGDSFIKKVLPDNYSSIEKANKLPSGSIYDAFQDNKDDSKILCYINVNDVIHLKGNIVFQGYSSKSLNNMNTPRGDNKNFSPKDIEIPELKELTGETVVTVSVGFKSYPGTSVTDHSFSRFYFGNSANNARVEMMYQGKRHFVTISKEESVQHVLARTVFGKKFIANVPEVLANFDETRSLSLINGMSVEEARLNIVNVLEVFYKTPNGEKVANAYLKLLNSNANFIPYDVVGKYNNMYLMNEAIARLGFKIPKSVHVKVFDDQQNRLEREKLHKALSEYDKLANEIKKSYKLFKKDERDIEGLTYQYLFDNLPALDATGNQYTDNSLIRQVQKLIKAFSGIQTIFQNVAELISESNDSFEPGDPEETEPVRKNAKDTNDYPEVEQHTTWSGTTNLKKHIAAAGYIVEYLGTALLNLKGHDLHQQELMRATRLLQDLENLTAKALKENVINSRVYQEAIRKIGDLKKRINLPYGIINLKAPITGLIDEVNSLITDSYRNDLNNITQVDIISNLDPLKKFSSIITRIHTFQSEKQSEPERGLPLGEKFTGLHVITEAKLYSILFSFISSRVNASDLVPLENAKTKEKSQEHYDATTGAILRATLKKGLDDGVLNNVFMNVDFGVINSEVELANKFWKQYSNLQSYFWGIIKNVNMQRKLVFEGNAPKENSIIKADSILGSSLLKEHGWGTSSEVALNNVLFVYHIFKDLKAQGFSFNKYPVFNIVFKNNKYVVPNYDLCINLIQSFQKQSQEHADALTIAMNNASISLDQNIRIINAGLIKKSRELLNLSNNLKGTIAKVGVREETFTSDYKRLFGDNEIDQFKDIPANNINIYLPHYEIKNNAVIPKIEIGGRAIKYNQMAMAVANRLIASINRQVNKTYLSDDFYHNFLRELNIIFYHDNQLAYGLINNNSSSHVYSKTVGKGIQYFDEEDDTPPILINTTATELVFSVDKTKTKKAIGKLISLMVNGKLDKVDLDKDVKFAIFVIVNNIIHNDESVSNFTNKHVKVPLETGTHGVNILVDKNNLSALSSSALRAVKFIDNIIKTKNISLEKAFNLLSLDTETIVAQTKSVIQYIKMFEKASKFDFTKDVHSVFYEILKWIGNNDNVSKIEYAIRSEQDLYTFVYKHIVSDKVNKNEIKVKKIEGSISLINPDEKKTLDTYFKNLKNNKIYEYRSLQFGLSGKIENRYNLISIIEQIAHKFGVPISDIRILPSSVSIGYNAEMFVETKTRTIYIPEHILTTKDQKAASFRIENNKTQSIVAHELAHVASTYFMKFDRPDNFIVQIAHAILSSDYENYTKSYPNHFRTKESFEYEFIVAISRLIPKTKKSLNIKNYNINSVDDINYDTLLKLLNTKSAKRSNRMFSLLDNSDVANAVYRLIPEEVIAEALSSLITSKLELNGKNFRAEINKVVSKYIRFLPTEAKSVINSFYSSPMFSKEQLASRIYFYKNIRSKIKTGEIDRVQLDLMLNELNKTVLYTDVDVLAQQNALLFKNKQNASVRLTINEKEKFTRIFGEKEVIVFDIETTGLGLKDEIVSITLYKITKSGSIQVVDQKFNITMALGSSSDVHNISLKELTSSPRFQDVALAIRNFIGEGILVGYNSDRFDIPKLNYFFKEYGIKPIVNKGIDIYKLLNKKAASKKYSGSLKLEDINEKTISVLFGIKEDEILFQKGAAHTSKADAFKTLQIMQYTIEHIDIQKTNKQFSTRKMNANTSPNRYTDVYSVDQLINSIPEVLHERIREYSNMFNGLTKEEKSVMLIDYQNPLPLEYWAKLKYPDVSNYTLNEFIDNPKILREYTNMLSTAESNFGKHFTIYNHVTDKVKKAIGILLYGDPEALNDKQAAAYLQLLRIHNINIDLSEVPFGEHNNLIARNPKKTINENKALAFFTRSDYFSYVEDNLHKYITDSLNSIDSVIKFYSTNTSKGLDLSFKSSVSAGVYYAKMFLDVKSALLNVNLTQLSNNQLLGIQNLYNVIRSNIKHGGFNDLCEYFNITQSDVVSFVSNLGNKNNIKDESNYFKIGVLFLNLDRGKDLDKEQIDKMYKWYSDGNMWVHPDSTEEENTKRLFEQGRYMFMIDADKLQGAGRRTLNSVIDDSDDLSTSLNNFNFNLDKRLGKTNPTIAALTKDLVEIIKTTVALKDLKDVDKKSFDSLMTMANSVSNLLVGSKGKSVSQAIKDLNSFMANLQSNIIDLTESTMSFMKDGEFEKAEKGLNALSILSRSLTNVSTAQYRLSQEKKEDEYTKRQKKLEKDAAAKEARSEQRYQDNQARILKQDQQREAYKLLPTTDLISSNYGVNRVGESIKYSGKDFKFDEIRIDTATRKRHENLNPNISGLYMTALEQKKYWKNKGVDLDNILNIFDSSALDKINRNGLSPEEYQRQRNNIAAQQYDNFISSLMIRLQDPNTGSAESNILLALQGAMHPHGRMISYNDGSQIEYRKNQEARQQELDERSEQRYQESQARILKQDQEREVYKLLPTTDLISSNYGVNRVGEAIKYSGKELKLAQVGKMPEDIQNRYKFLNANITGLVLAAEEQKRYWKDKGVDLGNILDVFNVNSLNEFNKSLKGQNLSLEEYRRLLSNEVFRNWDKFVNDVTRKYQNPDISPSELNIIGSLYSALSPYGNRMSFDDGSQIEYRENQEARQQELDERSEQRYQESQERYKRQDEETRKRNKKLDKRYQKSQARIAKQDQEKLEQELYPLNNVLGTSYNSNTVSKALLKENKKIDFNKISLNMQAADALDGLNHNIASLYLGVDAQKRFWESSGVDVAPLLKSFDINALSSIDRTGKTSEEINNEAAMIVRQQINEFVKTNLAYSASNLDPAQRNVLSSLFADISGHIKSVPNVPLGFGSNLKKPNEIYTGTYLDNFLNSFDREFTPLATKFEDKKNLKLSGNAGTLLRSLRDFVGNLELGVVGKTGLLESSDFKQLLNPLFDEIETGVAGIKIDPKIKDQDKARETEQSQVINSAISNFVHKLNNLGGELYKQGYNDKAGLHIGIANATRSLFGVNIKTPGYSSNPELKQSPDPKIEALLKDGKYTINQKALSSIPTAKLNLPIGTEGLLIHVNNFKTQLDVLKSHFTNGTKEFDAIYEKISPKNIGLILDNINKKAKKGEDIVPLFQQEMRGVLADVAGKLMYLQGNVPDDAVAAFTNILGTVDNAMRSVGNKYPSPDKPVRSTNAALEKLGSTMDGKQINAHFGTYDSKAFGPEMMNIYTASMYKTIVPLLNGLEEMKFAGGDNLTNLIKDTYQQFYTKTQKLSIDNTLTPQQKTEAARISQFGYVQELLKSLFLLKDNNKDAVPLINYLSNELVKAIPTYYANSGGSGGGGGFKQQQDTPIRNFPIDTVDSDRIFGRYDRDQLSSDSFTASLVKFSSVKTGKHNQPKDLPVDASIADNTINTSYRRNYQRALNIKEKIQALYKIMKDYGGMGGPVHELLSNSIQEIDLKLTPGLTQHLKDNYTPLDIINSYQAAVSNDQLLGKFAQGERPKYLDVADAQEKHAQKLHDEYIKARNRVENLQRIYDEQSRGENASFNRAVYSKSKNENKTQDEVRVELLGKVQEKLDKDRVKLDEKRALAIKAYDVANELSSIAQFFKFTQNTTIDPSVENYINKEKKLVDDFLPNVHGALNKSISGIFKEANASILKGQYGDTNEKLDAVRHTTIVSRGFLNALAGDQSNTTDIISDKQLDKIKKAGDYYSTLQRSIHAVRGDWFIIAGITAGWTASSVRTFTNIVSALAEAGEIQNMFKEAFRSSNKKGRGTLYDAELFAGTYSEASNVNIYKLKQQMGIMQTLQTSLSIPDKQATEMTKKAARMAIDISSYYNTPLDQSFKAIESAIVGDVRSLKRISGISAKQEIVKEWAVQRGHLPKESDWSAITEDQRSMLRANYILEKGITVKDDMIRTNISLQNSMRLLTEQWQEFLVVVGKDMQSVLENMSRSILTVVKDMTNIWQSNPILKLTAGIGLPAAGILGSVIGNITVGGIAGGAVSKMALIGKSFMNIARTGGIDKAFNPLDLRNFEKTLALGLSFGSDKVQAMQILGSLSKSAMDKMFIDPESQLRMMTALGTNEWASFSFGKKAFDTIDKDYGLKEYYEEYQKFAEAKTINKTNAEKIAMGPAMKAEFEKTYGASPEEARDKKFADFQKEWADKGQKDADLQARNITKAIGAVSILGGLVGAHAALARDLSGPGKTISAIGSGISVAGGALMFFPKTAPVGLALSIAGPIVGAVGANMSAAQEIDLTKRGIIPKIQSEFQDVSAISAAIAESKYATYSKEAGDTVNAPYADQALYDITLKDLSKKQRDAVKNNIASLQLARKKYIWDALPIILKKENSYEEYLSYFDKENLGKAKNAGYDMDLYSGVEGRRVLSALKPENLKNYNAIEAELEAEQFRLKLYDLKKAGKFEEAQKYMDEHKAYLARTAFTVEPTFEMKLKQYSEAYGAAQIDRKYDIIVNSVKMMFDNMVDKTGRMAQLVTWVTDFSFQAISNKYSDLANFMTASQLSDIAAVSIGTKVNSLFSSVFSSVSAKRDIAIQETMYPGIRNVNIKTNALKRETLSKLYDLYSPALKEAKKLDDNGLRLSSIENLIMNKLQGVSGTDLQSLSILEAQLNQENIIALATSQTADMLPMLFENLGQQINELNAGIKYNLTGDETDILGIKQQRLDLMYKLMEGPEGAVMRDKYGVTEAEVKAYITKGVKVVTGRDTNSKPIEKLLSELEPHEVAKLMNMLPVYMAEKRFAEREEHGKSFQNYAKSLFGEDGLKGKTDKILEEFAVAAETLAQDKLAELQEGLQKEIVNINIKHRQDMAVKAINEIGAGLLDGAGAYLTAVVTGINRVFDNAMVGWNELYKFIPSLLTNKPGSPDNIGVFSAQLAQKISGNAANFFGAFAGDSLGMFGQPQWAINEFADYRASIKSNTAGVRDQLSPLLTEGKTIDQAFKFSAEMEIAMQEVVGAISQGDAMNLRAINNVLEANKTVAELTKTDALVNGTGLSALLRVNEMQLRGLEDVVGAINNLGYELKGSLGGGAVASVINSTVNGSDNPFGDGFTWNGKDWHNPRKGGRLHEGTDAFAPAGTPIRALISGIYRTSNSPLGGIGAWVGDTYYAHMQERVGNFKNGDWVTAGTIIGKVGSTGNASPKSPHLHFGYKPGGVWVNPEPYLRGTKKWGSKRSSEDTKQGTVILKLPFVGPQVPYFEPIGPKAPPIPNPIFGDPIDTTSKLMSFSEMLNSAPPVLNTTTSTFQVTDLYHRHRKGILDYLNAAGSDTANLTAAQKEELIQSIMMASQLTGYHPAIFLGMIDAESSFNPTDRNTLETQYGYAHGLFQVMSGFDSGMESFGVGFGGDKWIWDNSKFDISRNILYGGVGRLYNVHTVGQKNLGNYQRAMLNFSGPNRNVFNRYLEGNASVIGANPALAKFFKGDTSLFDPNKGYKYFLGDTFDAVKTELAKSGVYYKDLSNTSTATGYGAAASDANTSEFGGSNVAAFNPYVMKYNADYDTIDGFINELKTLMNLATKSSTELEKKMYSLNVNQLVNQFKGVEGFHIAKTKIIESMNNAMEIIAKNFSIAVDLTLGDMVGRVGELTGMFIDKASAYTSTLSTNYSKFGKTSVDPYFSKFFDISSAVSDAGQSRAQGIIGRRNVYKNNPSVIASLMMKGDADKMSYANKRYNLYSSMIAKTSLFDHLRSMPNGFADMVGGSDGAFAQALNYALGLEGEEQVNALQGAFRAHLNPLVQKFGFSSWEKADVNAIRGENSILAEFVLALQEDTKATKDQLKSSTELALSINELNVRYQEMISHVEQGMDLGLEFGQSIGLGGTAFKDMLSGMVSKLIIGSGRANIKSSILGSVFGIRGSEGEAIAATNKYDSDLQALVPSYQQNTDKMAEGISLLTTAVQNGYLKVIDYSKTANAFDGLGVDLNDMAYNPWFDRKMDFDRIGVDFQDLIANQNKSEFFVPSDFRPIIEETNPMLKGDFATKLAKDGLLPKMFTDISASEGGAGLGESIVGTVLGSSLLWGDYFSNANQSAGATREAIASAGSAFNILGVDLNDMAYNPWFDRKMDFDRIGVDFQDLIANQNKSEFFVPSDFRPIEQGVESAFNILGDGNAGQKLGTGIFVQLFGKGALKSFLSGSGALAKGLGMLGVTPEGALGFAGMAVIGMAEKWITKTLFGKGAKKPTVELPAKPISVKVVNWDEAGDKYAKQVGGRRGMIYGSTMDGDYRSIDGQSVSLGLD